MSKKQLRYPRYLFRKNLALDFLKTLSHLNTSVLEIGAGDRSLSFCLDNVNADIIEISEQAVLNLEIEKPNNIKLINADFNQFEFEKKYDLIIALEVMEHIKDDQLFLKKIYDLLNDNGLLLLSVPAKMKKWNISDKLAGHYRRYEKKGLINLLHESNLNSVKFISYGFPIINMTSFIRDKLFRTRIDESNMSKDQDFRSKESGTGLQKYLKFEGFVIAVMNLIFNEKTIMVYSFIFKPFNKYDLGDGYLCLLEKSTKNQVDTKQLFT